jgi:DNA-binding MarR family transcriptional regulator
VGLLLARWTERLLAAHEPPLTIAQYAVLEAIAEGGSVGADLARRAAVTPAAVSQHLAALERAGLVERARTDADRRRQALALTPDGVRTLDSARAAVRDRLRELLADLPAPEVDALRSLLPRLESLLAGTAPPPRPPRPPRPPGPRGAR